MVTILGILIPFLGTSLGASMVFLMKNKLNPKTEKILLGNASGVMVAASVWSLLIPAIETAEKQNMIAWLPAAVGFAFGILFLLLLDNIVPHIHLNSDVAEGMKSTLKKTTKLVLTVTLHNIPEGMAVGVALAGMLTDHSGITFAGAFALAIGIAVQNVPEGAVVSMTLQSEGKSKGEAFLYGMLSGTVEPIGAFLTLLFTGVIEAVLPYLLAFAAGAMIYVVIEELIPQSQNDEHSDLGTIGFSLGFLIMMILDVALG